MQSVKIKLRPCFLLNPGSSGVFGAEDGSPSSNCPAVVVADEINIQEGGTRFRSNGRPGSTAVDCPEDRASFTYSDAFFVVPEIHVINGRCKTSVLLKPGFTGIYRS